MDRDRLMTNKKAHGGQYRDSLSNTRETVMSIEIV